MSKLIKPKRKGSPLIINRLAAILKEERIANKDLAESLGYEPATVSKWATNTIQPPLTTFLRIALTLNRDLKDFFVSTKEINVEEKAHLLERLVKIAERAKKSGNNKS